ncbi:MAG: hypothetical protein IKB73_06940 [Ruminococcus sp.]|nr:hypothetical protein [Ruminococcus sp.]
MKKFIIVSVSLILVAAGVFSLSLYSFFSKSEDKTEPDLKETVVEKATKDEVKKEVKTDTDYLTLLSDNGIFSDNYEKAYDYVSKMTKEQMVGQMILSSCPTDESDLDLVTRYALGGYVFTSDNFYSLDASGIKDKLSKYNESASTPMVMAVKEEGGAVTTVSDLPAFTEYNFAHNRETFVTGGMDQIKVEEQKKAEMLSSIGINLNLAPVCDMAVEQNQIMYSRSLGGTVEETCEFVKNVTEISQSKGVSVALKHFPGYGTTPDTMDAVVTDTRENSVFETNDFKPFEAGVEAKSHCVMVSNVLVQSLDPTCVASLSDYIHTILRERIGFTGLAITDNLDSADYSGYSGGKNVYVQAVLSGNDMIMVDKAEDAYMAILNGLNDGTIDEEIIKKACLRIIAYKYTAGILV